MKNLKSITALKLFAVVISTLFFSLCSAQDIITLKTGEEIKSKVAEIEDAAIKYKKFENLNGPTYSIPKSQVFMIHYENGTKEVYNAQPSQPTTEKKNTENKQVVVKKPKPELSATDKNTMSAYRKEIVGGAVMTGLSVPCIAIGSTLCVLGAVAEAPTEEFDIHGNMTTTYHDGEGMPLWLPGAFLTAAGVAMIVAGPIQLSKGLKQRKAFKSGSAYLDFKPINDKYFDTHFHTMNYQTLGAITLNF